MFVLKHLKTHETCTEGDIRYETFQDAMNARAKLARSMTHYIHVSWGADIENLPTSSLRGVNEVFDEVFDSPDIKLDPVERELKDIFQVLGMNDARLKDLI
tara:strand:+ start:4861 stop:5163 length:303 start_codon:yes stop_codon:yes gene_type:complete